jgi:hypothetical protein
MTNKRAAAPVVAPKLYLAGPMSGLPQFNFPAFYAATEMLRAQGYDIVSPAELDDAEDSGAAMKSPDGDPNNRDAVGGKTWGDFLARDVKLLADAGITGIIFLDGWQKSKGAKLEAFVGVLGKLKFYTYSTKQYPTGVLVDGREIMVEEAVVTEVGLGWVMREIVEQYREEITAYAPL